MVIVDEYTFKRTRTHLWTAPLKPAHKSYKDFLKTFRTARPGQSALLLRATITKPRFGVAMQIATRQSQTSRKASTTILPKGASLHSWFRRLFAQRQKTWKIANYSAHNLEQHPRELLWYATVHKRDRAYLRECYCFGSFYTRACVLALICIQRIRSSNPSVFEQPPTILKFPFSSFQGYSN